MSPAESETWAGYWVVSFNCLHSLQLGLAQSKCLRGSLVGISHGCKNMSDWTPHSLPLMPPPAPAPMFSDLTGCTYQTGLAHFRKLVTPSPALFLLPQSLAIFLYGISVFVFPVYSAPPPETRCLLLFFSGLSSNVSSWNNQPSLDYVANWLSFYRSAFYFSVFFFLILINTY